MPNIESRDKQPKRFRVAFSFAGEKRKFVAKVARILADRFGEDKILYDKFHEAEFARYDLGIYLPKLYGEQSELIVPVICPNYDQKRWTGWEWVHIYGLLTKSDGHRVMPCRFKRAKADGLTPAAGFVELDDKSPETTATLILERLALNEGKPKGHYTKSIGASSDTHSTSVARNLPPLQRSRPAKQPGQHGAQTRRSYSDSEVTGASMQTFHRMYRERLREHLRSILKQRCPRGVEFLLPPRFDEIDSATAAPLSTTAFSLKDLALEPGSFAVVGEAGAGKSVALLLLIEEMLRLRSRAIPILITREDVKETDLHSAAPDQKGLLRFLAALLSRMPSPIQRSSEPLPDIAALLSRARPLVLCVDGIDQIDLDREEGKRFSQWLSEAIRSCPARIDVRWIVTSRENRYEDFTTDDRHIYRPRKWGVPELKLYFGERSSEYKLIYNNQDLRSLFDRPLMCHFMAQNRDIQKLIADGQSLQRLGKEATLLYTSFFRNSFREREGLPLLAMEALGIIANEDSAGQLVTREEAVRHVDLLLHENVDGMAGNLSAREITDKWVSACVLQPVSETNPSLHFCHETYREYAVAYRVNSLLRRFNRDWVQFGNDYFANLGEIEMTVDIYPFARDLCSGRLHREKFRQLTLSFDVVIRALREFSSAVAAKRLSLSDWKTRNAFIILVQIMRGFQYDAAEDPALGREVEASREHAIKVLTALFKLGDIIVQREVACSLVGFGERGYLKRVLECMMVEKTAFDQHKEYMKRIWRFDEEDQLKADRARRIAWSIIKSTRGFRTHLRAINVFSLAQFSHSVEDVADLERLKIEENTKPMRDRDRLLLKTIDYCVTLIQKETLPTSQDSNLRTKRP